MVNDGINNVVRGGLVGVLVGAIGMAGFLLSAGQNIEKAKVFKEENKPAVMRIYRNGADQILVENPELEGEHRALYRHLSDIKDLADRELEEARIKKLVGWYKE